MNHTMNKTTLQSIPRMVSVSDLQRKARKIFDELDDAEPTLVLNRNRTIGVVLKPSVYEELKSLSWGIVIECIHIASHTPLTLKQKPFISTIFSTAYAGIGNLENSSIFVFPPLSQTILDETGCPRWGTVYVEAP